MIEHIFIRISVFFLSAFWCNYENSNLAPSWLLPGNENETVMWHCQLVLCFHVFAQKKAYFFDVVLLMSHQRFCGSCISWFSAKNHLQNIRHLKVIVLSVPHRLQSAGCWMPLNWKRPYLKGNRCRQSFKNIKKIQNNTITRSIIDF